MTTSSNSAQQRAQDRSIAAKALARMMEPALAEMQQIAELSTQYLDSLKTTDQRLSPMHWLRLLPGTISLVKADRAYRIGMPWIAGLDESSGREGRAK
jgi:hypothetical protein